MRPPELTTGSTTSSWPWKSLSPRIWTSIGAGTGFFAATMGTDIVTSIAIAKPMAAARRSRRKCNADESPLGAVETGAARSGALRGSILPPAAGDRHSRVVSAWNRGARVHHPVRGRRRRPLRWSRGGRPLLDSRPDGSPHRSVHASELPRPLHLDVGRGLVIAMGAIVVYTMAQRRYRRYQRSWPSTSGSSADRRRLGVIPLLTVIGVPLILQLAIVLPAVGVAAYAAFIRFPPRIAAANDEIHRRRFVPPPKRSEASRSKPTPAGRRRRHR